MRREMFTGELYYFTIGGVPREDVRLNTLAS